MLTAASGAFRTDSNLAVVGSFPPSYQRPAGFGNEERADFLLFHFFLTSFRRLMVRFNYGDQHSNICPTDPKLPSGGALSTLCRTGLIDPYGRRVCLAHLVD